MSPDSKHRLLIEQRRAETAKLIASGLRYRDILEKLRADERFSEVGVSLGTVSDDVKVILKRLRQEQIQDYGDKLALEELRLDVALEAIWPLIDKGHLGAIDRLLKIAERRAKLLGLDAALSFSLTAGDMSDKTDAELQAIINGRSSR